MICSAKMFFVILGAVLAIGIPTEGTITCYSGTYSNHTTYSSCKACESIMYYKDGYMNTVGACNVTGCSNTSTMSNGYKATSTCCYTDNCNTPSAPVSSTITCYSGGYTSGSAVNTTTGCSSCETIEYKSNDILYTVGQCLSTTSCSSGDTTYEGNSAVSSCCYYDMCNTVSAPVSGPTEAAHFSCYEKSAAASLTTTSAAICAACQTITSSKDTTTYTAKYCCETTSDCTANSVSYEGTSVTSVLCYSDLCNGSGSSSTSGSRSLCAGWSTAVLVVVLFAAVEMMIRSS